MATIKKIMCCCGSGLGSSMMVQMNIEKALKNLGIEGVTAEHTSLSEVTPKSADLFVVGKDIAPQLASYPRVVVLDKIMSMKELTAKLEQAFAKTEDEFHIQ
ncbi:PTS sugar transporter subunit IIB [Catenisphaera adipataccumulans]|jgi:PTS system ascorbate-specific IIB component|uniref:PTS system ascorbate-specific IIB component n=1 Tax=Catenisphaera adipataccumulans TaxID=700500 RepID=A0A7W8CWW8_9FIRM|nr:PTS sugar transporter subunit IIB [Catenisphaera adipataccumulans]MBB5183120.1 PTS system ascorbate-specific IIB component [Catenisphaera adipataccumulans]